MLARADTRRDVDALVVDRDRHDRGAGADQRGPHVEIAGLLDPGAIAGVEQQPEQDVEGLLRAARDDHLAPARSGRRARRSMWSAIACAQGPISGRVAVVEIAAAVDAPLAAESVAPRGATETRRAPDAAD